MALATVGRFILGLGILGIVRVIPEMVTIRGVDRLYGVIVALDLIMAFLMVVAGTWVLRGQAWAPRLALRAGGAVVATSIGWGLLLAPEVLSAFRGPGMYSSSLPLVPRMLFYVIAIGFWPYAARALVYAAPPESRKSLWASFAGGLAVGTVMMIGLSMSFR